MPKLSQILLILLVIVFIFTLFLSIQMMFINPFTSQKDTREKSEKQFHYAFFLPASDYSFFRNLKDGAINASLTSDCSISIHSIDTDPISFEMASFLGLDGVAVYLYKKDDQLIQNINKIAKAGIPIILIENEISLPVPTFFIGTNSFDSGKGIGKLALLADKTDLHVALVYSNKNPGLISDSSLLEMGIKTTIGENLRELRTETTSLNPLDAEKLTYELMKQSPPVDIIVLTDPNDTLVTIQTIIDMNLVGKVQIIGFGDTAVIREYISKGVLLGSIVRNPYQIGFSAVMALKEISMTGYTSAYVDTGIHVLSLANVSNSEKGEPIP